MISENVKAAYDDFYAKNDVAWRMLSAKFKAKNIVDVCKAISPKKILEVGAGDGSILHYLNEWKFGSELYALEIAQTGVDKIKALNLSTLKEVQTFDGYKIPYADDSFDLVILAHVLEHVEHERILLRELKRIAKYVVIEVPKDYRFGVDKRIKHFLDYGHINMYTPTSLRFLLKSEGLEIVTDKTSMTEPAVNFFNEFINKKAKKSVVKKLRINLEYFVKKTIGNVLGKKKKEQFANAYTVLSKKSDHDIKIF
ncbi:class I SAM-dependent methyltransferase [Pedobacter changchengzhani]|uniref:Class I SAM-dependent methyltransferase n=1 Tax=Pedobacter changchengzhani TaxID=2529274 RepID=A0A4R5MNX5_9SPHI|nr:class I SAM-dependent methyltransferase [Pedobacter changchengzhani]